MLFLHLGPVQLEVRRRPFAGMMIPPIGEQNPTDIQEPQVIAVAFVFVFSFVDRIIVATGSATPPNRYSDS